MTTETTRAQLQQRIRDLENEKQALLNTLHRTEVSEKLHRLTLENIADTVLITDDEDRFIYVCPNTTMIFGLTKVEIFRLGRLAILMGGIVCDRSKLKKEGILKNIEWAAKDRSGEERFLLITAKSVQIEGGTCLYVMRDITARKRAEIDLAESEGRFRSIIDVLPQFVSYVDREYRYRFANRTYQKKFGMAPEAIIGKAVKDVIGEAAFEKGRPYAEKALRGEKTRYTVQFDYANGGGIRDIDGILIPDKGSDGEVHGYYGVLTDISPYMQMQKQLQESELKYRNLINSLPGTAYQFILSSDGEFRFEFMGENCRRLFGYGADEILADAKLVFDLIPPPDADEVQAAIRRSADTMQPYEVKHRVVKKTGETLWIHAVSIPRKLPNGGTIWDGIGLDDTQCRLSEEARQRSYHELKLREAIANLFLTSPKERLFSDILARLRAEFDCQYGFVGYIDEKGGLCCPSLTRDSGKACRMRDKSAVFPEAAWAGMWGDSLKERRSLRKNAGLTPPPGHVPLTNALIVPMLVNDQLVGQIGLANTASGFLADDQKQLEALAEFLAPILYLYLEKERHFDALQRTAIKLAEKNTALNVLLDNRVEEQKRLADSILLNFERLVLPYFDKLKATSSRETIATILDIVAANIRESLAPFEKSVSFTYRAFTPMEIQVADLVKTGKTSKQIAAILNISPRSVYFHRNNIRTKLGIHNTNQNLGALLRSMSGRP